MSKSIFVIDDYLINLKVAEMIIKHHGFFDSITTFEEAQLALDFLISEQKNDQSLPDVILLDLSMPVMDGWQFLDKFEELAPLLNKRIDIYILSSSTDIRDKMRANRYPTVKDYFTKPISEEMLQDIRATILAYAS
ncbi:MAG: response regulator [Sphingobacteriaceae bacterium]|nr:response regulator [Sphingobacteriaceae bacterium]